MFSLSMVNEIEYSGHRRLGARNQLPAAFVPLSVKAISERGLELL